MSFILDALRKAERDRNLGQAPRMEDVALAPETAPGTTPAPAKRPLRWLIALALMLIAAAIAVSAWRQRHPQTKLESPVADGIVTATVRGPAPVDRSPAETPVPSRPAAAPAAPSSSTAPALPDDEVLNSFDDLEAVSTGDAAQAGIADGRAPVDASIDREPPVDFIARAPDAASDRPIVEPAEPPSAAPTAAVEAAASASADDSLSLPAVPLSDMPSDYRRDFPALSVEVHVWDGEPSRRFVLIGGKRYVEGQSLAEGPQLLQITQDGLVLEYRGSRVAYSLQ